MLIGCFSSSLNNDNPLDLKLSISVHFDETVVYGKLPSEQFRVKKQFKYKNKVFFAVEKHKNIHLVFNFVYLLCSFLLCFNILICVSTGRVQRKLSDVDIE